MELNVEWNWESNFIKIFYEVKNNLIKNKLGQPVVQNSTRHKFTQNCQSNEFERNYGFYIPRQISKLINE